MLGFHIDFNTAHFNPQYLRKWLRQLADLGYDTIVWELEDYVRWDICPETASAEALSKIEFTAILDYSRSLGLKNIPLLQCLAHSEYVLKHEKHYHLSEKPGSLSSYCPRNEKVHQFLTAWISEYLEVFHDAEYFHLGCDEAFKLGKECPSCSTFILEHSKSELVVTHINRLAAILLKRQITPIIWADMVLTHHESINLLSRDIMLFDWRYEIYRGNGKVWGWDEVGGRLYTGETIPENIKKTFMKWLYPLGDELAREPEPFYTADYLKEMGFKVVTCPTASCYQDNVFAPRNFMHIANIFDSTRKGNTLEGSVVTSWTVHLFPYELQFPAIAAAKYALNNDYSLEAFQVEFSKYFFGLANNDFFIAAGLLSKNCLFSYGGTLGFGKFTRPAESGHIKRILARELEANRLDANIENCRSRKQEYGQAKIMFEQLLNQELLNRDLVEKWLLAARNLENRANVSLLILQMRKADSSMDTLRPGNDEITAVLSELRLLKQLTEEMYQSISMPQRREEIIGWIFNAVEEELAGYINIKGK